MLKTKTEMGHRNRLIALFFIALLAAPLVVTTFRYQQARYAVRKAVKQQMIAGIDRRHLTMLVFSHNHIQRLLRWEHDGEFEYKGQMYDVVETTSDRDSVRYLCWPDHHETRLNRHLNHLVSQALGAHPLNKASQKRLLDFLTKLFPPPATTALLGAVNDADSWLRSAPGRLFSRAVETDLPPPRFV